MKALLDAWHRRSPRERAAVIVMFGGLAVLAAGSLVAALHGELARLGRALPQAEARWQRMQDDVAEIARLRGQPPRAPQAAPAEAVVASLRSRGLALTVAAQGTDRLHVSGAAAFDATVAWLADVQRDFRLRPATFSAVRGDGGARIEIVLVPAAP